MRRWLKEVADGVMTHRVAHGGIKGASAFATAAAGRNRKNSFTAPGALSQLHLCRNRRSARAARYLLSAI